MKLVSLTEVFFFFVSVPSANDTGVTTYEPHHYHQLLQNEVQEMFGIDAIVLLLVKRRV